MKMGLTEMRTVLKLNGKFILNTDIRKGLREKLVFELGLERQERNWKLANVGKPSGESREREKMSAVVDPNVNTGQTGVSGS